MSSQFIYGIKPIEEALAAEKTFDKIWVAEGQQENQLGALLQELAFRKIRWKAVPPQKLNNLAKGQNHQGIIASLSAIEFTSLDDIIQSAYDKGEDPLIIMLDGVSDVRNFGAIVRTAACAGAHGVVMPNHGGAAISPDSVKTSAGALLTMPVCKSDNTYKTIKTMQVQGLKVIGISEKTETNIFDANDAFTGPCVLVMGDEEKGLSTDAWKACDGHAKIPLSDSGIESLNVSVAAGIAMFEAIKQRSNAK